MAGPHLQASSEREVGGDACGKLCRIGRGLGRYGFQLSLSVGRKWKNAGRSGSETKRLLLTGNHKFGRGSGGVGWQTNLPLSIQHTAHWVTHWHAGATWIPHALDERRESAATT